MDSNPESDGSSNVSDTNESIFTLIESSDLSIVVADSCVMALPVTDSIEIAPMVLGSDVLPSVMAYSGEKSSTPQIANTAEIDAMLADCETMTPLTVDTGEIEAMLDTVVPMDDDYAKIFGIDCGPRDPELRCYAVKRYVMWIPGAKKLLQRSSLISLCSLLF